MNHAIDWLSFTFSAVGEGNSYHRDSPEFVAACLSDYLPALEEWCGRQLEWQRAAGRSPYAYSLKSPFTGVTFFWSPSRMEILCEMSGTGCARMRDAELLPTILEHVKDRITRLDIATDISTETRPGDFVDAGFTSRTKTIGRFTSRTGETVYVGSQKSDKYVRVYRYDDPHPRADLLRVEAVYRRKHATRAAEMVLRLGTAIAAVSLHEGMKWQHEAWNPSDEPSPVPALPKQQKTDAGTLHWLVTQVAPAFKRMVEEEHITNPEEWLKENFLTGLAVRS